jgi:hypothetical protein
MKDWLSFALSLWYVQLRCDGCWSSWQNDLAGRTFWTVDVKWLVGAKSMILYRKMFFIWWLSIRVMEFYFSKWGLIPGVGGQCRFGWRLLTAADWLRWRGSGRARLESYRHTQLIYDLDLTKANEKLLIIASLNSYNYHQQENIECWGIDTRNLLNYPSIVDLREKRGNGVKREFKAGLSV